VTSPGAVIRRAVGEEKRVRFAGRPPIRIALRGLARRMAWDDVSRDLVELAAGVLVTDRLVRRAGARPRTIHLSLAMRRPELFRAAESELREVLALLTGDRFSFGFRRARRREFVLGTESGSRDGLELDQVVLFSGGLDSACAAADLARRRGRVGYVTQYTKGIEAVEGLLAEIYARVGASRPFEHAGYFVQPWGPVVGQLHENARRSRSFLFLSLALATAGCTRAGEVLVCENGPLALNLPLGPEMVPTRHAHSQFLGAMERLAQTLFGRRLRVRNPYELKTKGEMAKVFRDHPGLALRTISCWYQQWSGRGSSYGKGHCGHCLPCLVRLVSLTAAGIDFPRRHFDVDVRRLARKGRPTLEDRRRLEPMRRLVGFASAVVGCRSWRDFIQQFPDAVESEPTSHEMTSDQWYRRLYRTERRFAAEVLACLAG